jgi:16S rRNA (uracil1498-N3)-methyltransferase
MTLGDREAHHLRNVLRLKGQTAVEVFDDAGHVGVGVLGKVGEAGVTVLVESIRAAEAETIRVVIASAVPKAARGDWLVEKLGELGVDTFIPLATERSIVLPEGKNKLERWQRLASEAAQQSHRRGVMRIEALTPLAKAVEGATAAGTAWYGSTAPEAIPLREMAGGNLSGTLTLFIGPEGDWSPVEIALFDRTRIPGMSLGRTILRIETAAIAAAAILMGLFAK